MKYLIMLVLMLAACSTIKAEKRHWVVGYMCTEHELDEVNNCLSFQYDAAVETHDMHYLDAESCLKYYCQEPRGK